MQSLIIKYKLNNVVKTLNLKEFGVCIYERVKIPTTKMRYETIDVPGRDGSLNIEQGYEDIEIDVTLNAIDKSLVQNIRALKLKLMNTIEFMLSDDRGVFYKVKAVEIDDLENNFKTYGKFTVQFRCEPFAFDTRGSQFIKFKGNVVGNTPDIREGTIYNYGMESEPIIECRVFEGKYAFRNVEIRINNRRIAKEIVNEKETLVYDAQNRTMYIKDENDAIIKTSHRQSFETFKHGENKLYLCVSGGRAFVKTNFKYL